MSKHARWDLDPLDLLTGNHLALLGRWGAYPGQDGVVTVNSGSRLRLAWRGTGEVVVDFGPNARPDAAHVYVLRPGRSMSLLELGDQPTSVRLSKPSQASSRELQEVDIVVKDVDEHLNRWEPPFEAAVWLRRIRLAPGVHLVPPARLKGPLMEFLGDSITQGVRVMNRSSGPLGSNGAASFAYLVARAFDAPARQVGFGGQGLLVPGNGRVPAAADTLRWNFAESPVDASFVPEVVVVALGTNDNGSGQAVARAYGSYLSLVRAQYPGAHLLGVVPAARNHDEWLCAAVDGLGDGRVSLVSPRDWLEGADYTDGVHPNAEGHRRLARGLVAHISSITGRDVVHR